MDVRLVALSRSMERAELGHRLRVARASAGMTQAQVAGGEVTAAYVSRIESGHRRPDVHLLERMATRMGIGLEELVAEVLPAEAATLDLALGNVEVTLRNDHPRRALELVDEVLARPATNSDAVVLRRAQWLRARALAACGATSGATAILEDLVVNAPGQLEEENLPILATLARCYLDAGQPDHAKRTATRAAEVVDSLGLDATPAAAEIAHVLVEIYELRGQKRRARMAAGGALLATASVGWGHERAMAYRAASSAAADTGAFHVASLLARKALVLFELRDHGRDLIELKVMAAELQLDQNPPQPEHALATLRDVDGRQQPGEKPRRPASLRFIWPAAAPIWRSANMARPASALRTRKIMQTRRHRRPRGLPPWRSRPEPTSSTTTRPQHTRSPSGPSRCCSKLTAKATFEPVPPGSTSQTFSPTSATPMVL